MGVSSDPPTSCLACLDALYHKALQALLSWSRKLCHSVSHFARSHSSLSRRGWERPRRFDTDPPSPLPSLWPGGIQTTLVALITPCVWMCLIKVRFLCVCVCVESRRTCGFNHSHTRSSCYLPCWLEGKRFNLQSEKQNPTKQIKSNHLGPAWESVWEWEWGRRQTFGLWPCGL